MILIVGSQSDVHVADVQEQLQTRDIGTMILDPTLFSGDTVRFCSSGNRLSCRIRSDSKSIDLLEVDTVWFRRARDPELRGDLVIDEAKFVASEVSHLLRSIWAMTKHANWVNPLESTIRADCKPYQLDAAHRLGIAVPDTLITADRTEVLDFCDKHHGDIIYKPLTSWSRVDQGRTLTVYTNRLDPSLLHEQLSGLEYSPCLFQNYIPKQTELRVVVIGEDIVAVSIDSQASDYSCVDWRKFDFENVKHASHSLPLAVAARILCLMRELGLVFGCLDLILTPDGEYILLEVNSAGSWMWLDLLAGTTITSAFASYLARLSREGDPTRSSPATSEVLPTVEFHNQ